jgi:DNA-binding MarR family transcriptional regulator
MTQSETIEESIFKLFKEMNFILKGFQNDTVISENITFRQFIILEHISTHEKLKMNELNTLLNVEKSTTTRLIEPLVRQGLIEKRKSDLDLRVFELSLTVEGKRIHKAVLMSIYEYIKNISKFIPIEKQENMKDTLQVFLNACTKCCETWSG